MPTSGRPMATASTTSSRPATGAEHQLEVGVEAPVCIRRLDDAGHPQGDEHGDEHRQRPRSSIHKLTLALPIEKATRSSPSITGGQHAGEVQRHHAPGCKGKASPKGGQPAGTGKLRSGGHAP